MISVEKVYANQFEQVYPLLELFNNQQLTKKDWEKIFITKWTQSPDHCGYALVDGDRVVGFIGTLFSKRIINGKQAKLCNITSWIVDPSFRNKSLLLLRPILQLRDYTITNLTPTIDTVSLFEKCYFEKLETSFKSFIPSFPLLRRKSKYSLVTETELIRSYLNENELNIHKDHKEPICKHLIVKSLSSYCYIVFNILKRKRLPCTQFYYISNPELFLGATSWIQHYLFKKYKSMLTFFDSRLLKGIKTNSGIKCYLNAPRLFRSPNLSSVEIDNLYTELLLLRL